MLNILPVAARETLTVHLLDDPDEVPDSLEEALEQLTANGSYDWIRPEEIGALTDAPILGTDVVRNDDGSLRSFWYLYWFPRYETADPVEELRTKGKLVFEGVPPYPLAPLGPDSH